jgi:hypothetical protein
MTLDVCFSFLIQFWIHSHSLTMNVFGGLLTCHLKLIYKNWSALSSLSVCSGYASVAVQDFQWRVFSEILTVFTLIILIIFYFLFA